MAKKSHEEKVNKATNMQDAIMGQLKETMAKAEEFKALLTKPLETKTIIVNGVNCVVQKFSDKVTVVLPSKEAVNDYYTNIGVVVKKECWYKKFKWSK